MNPLFQLQPLEPRLLLSADPLTGVFDDTLNAEITPVDDNCEALGELVHTLDKLAAIEATAGEKSDDGKESFVKPVVVSQGLFISTADDISSSPGEAGGDSSWGHNDVVSATNVSFEPTGSQSALFEQAFSLDAFADGTVEINGLHYVSTDITVGNSSTDWWATSTDLVIGDVLFSTASTVNFTGSDSHSVQVSAGDIGVFRPDTIGDYSSGTFIWLFNNVVGGQEDHDLAAFTLIEQDTSIAGNDLSAGDFLLVIDQSDYDDVIYHIEPNSTGMWSTEILIELVSEDGVNFDAKDIQGLEILETDQTVGGVSFSAGTLLVANDKNNKEEIRAYEFSGSDTDIKLGDATETVLWEMSDILNDDTTIDALTIANTVEFINVDPTGGVTIEGTATEDETLTANTSTLADEDGLGPLSYQWLRDSGVIVGATSDSYTLIDADAGSQISLQVSYTDGFNTDELVTSGATSAVTNINDSPTGGVIITGSAQEDETLSADTSGIADEDGLGSFSYQWLRDGSNIGAATAQNYTLTDSDVDSAITVTVSYTDGFGSNESLTSAATDNVTNINDAPVGLPVMNGIEQEDQTLSVDTSSISDVDGLGSFSYEWVRDGDRIIGSTNSSYVLGDDDVGSEIQARVIYTDGGGQEERVISAATGAIANINDLPTGTVTVLGNTVEDQVLTPDLSTLADDDGLGTFSYQWQRDGLDISGATSSSYVLTAADISSYMRVIISYTDDHGSVEQVISQNSSMVTGAVSTDVVVASISGTLEEYQPLTANVAYTDAIGNPLAPSNLQYQWFRDGVAISGATNASYTLLVDDVGEQMSVLVELESALGFQLSDISDETIAVVNVLDAPTGTVIITGTPTEDQTLNADTSSLVDNDGLGTFNYQWLRNGIAISGATNDSYTLTDDDVGLAISVQVSYTDGFGDSEQVISGDTANVANINDVLTGSLVVTGSAIEDQTLSVDTTSLADNDGLGAFDYQWLRDGVAIVDTLDAASANYLLREVDVGAVMSVQVSYTDGNGTLEQIVGSVPTAVTNVNDSVTGGVAITGNAQEDETLTADTSSLADEDGLGVLSYQWLRNGAALSGATASSYLLGDADVGELISVQVSYTDGNGDEEQVTSAQTSAVENINDPSMGIFAIAGTTTEDQALVVNVSSLTDDDGVGELGIQWLRDGVVIAGADGISYLLDDIDVGAQIAVQLSYTDGNGTYEQLTSNATGAVVGINDDPTGGVVISGTAAEDQTLTADTSTLVDADGLGYFDYQWLRNGAQVGTNSDSYVLSDADVGTTLSVQTSYIDGQGTGERLTSVATAIVTNINDVPTGSVQITGTVQEDQTIAADTTNLADDDGLGSFSYQWLGDGEVIDGATEASYALGDSDVGVVMSVQVSYTDGFGTFEQLSTMASSAVANVNDLPTDNLVLAGENRVGEELSVDLSKLIDADGIGDVSYQWLRDGEVIEGANEAIYELVEDDLNTDVSVLVSYIDSHGQSEVVTSKVVTVTDRPVYELVVANTAIDDSVESGLQDESQSAEVSDEASSRETTAENEDATDDANDGQNTELVGDTSSLQVFVIGALEGEEDFTQQQLTSFSSDFGDASSDQFGVRLVGISAFEYDSLSDAFTEDWFQSDTFASLENFLDPLVLVKNVAFNSSFDQLRQQYLDLSDEEQVMWTSTTTLSASFTVGYAVWLLRSGVLISTALSAMPAWRFIDPLPVLMSGGASAAGDEESLQSMVSESAAEATPEAKETC